MDPTRSVLVDRAIEQSILAGAWQSGHPELVVVHGRRRVGKSAILTAFADDRPIAYYVAAQQLEVAQLADLGRVVATLVTDVAAGAPPRLAFGDWDELLQTLGQAASGRRIGLILDEFPYLVGATRSLPSLIQRWWDRVGARSDVMVVLAGSEQAMMRDLVARDGALHGRPTRRLEVRPFDYYQAARFVGRWDPIDRVRAYAIAGGMPAYLERFDDRRTFRSEIVRLAFSPDGHLFGEAPDLLAREFHEPRTYETVLRAIAAGQSTPSEIGQQAGLPGANRVAPYLERLIALGLVERRTPPGHAAEVRPRVSRYVLADPYLRFYFGLLDPWRSAIAQGRGRAVFDRIWPTEFDRFVSRTFEDVARQYLLRLSGTGRLPPASASGQWWFPGGDIDAVVMSGRHVAAVAETKWTNAFLKPGDVEELRRNSAAVAPGMTPVMFVFSRSGFDPGVSAMTDVQRVGLDDLFAADLEYEIQAASPAGP